MTDMDWFALPCSKKYQAPGEPEFKAGDVIVIDPEIGFHAR